MNKAKQEKTCPACNGQKVYPPCNHPGCYAHVSHPCEGCGRRQGKCSNCAGKGIVVKHYFKEYEDKWWGGFTWLGYLNFILLQWFFIRLAKVLHNTDCPKIRFTYTYRIIGPIVPLTGWWDDYVYIGKKENKGR